MLPDANLRHQEALDCAQGQKAEAEFPFCPRSLNLAVMLDFISYEFMFYLNS